jgi:hypothetical protein
VEVPRVATEPPARRSSIAEGAGASPSWEAKTRRWGGSRARGEEACRREEGRVSVPRAVVPSRPCAAAPREGGNIALVAARRRSLRAELAPAWHRSSLCGCVTVVVERRRSPSTEREKLRWGEVERRGCGAHAHRVVARRGKNGGLISCSVYTVR